MSLDPQIRPEPGSRFGDLAALGRDAIWRAALGLLLILGGAMILNIALAEIYRLAGWGEALTMIAAHRADPVPPLAVRLQAFAFLMAGLIAFLPLMRVALPLLHRRPWRTFLTRGVWRWRRYWGAMSVMTSLLALMLLLQLVVTPAQFRFAPDWREIAFFAALAAVLVPLQVAAEEIFFRGYLMQLVGRATSWPALRIAIPALFFTLAHWQNPEAREGAAWALASYASAGLYLGLLALLDDGLESAMGAHLAINLFAILIVGSTASVSPSSVIWRELAPDYRASFFCGLVLFAVHGACMFRGRFKRRPPPADL